MINSNVNNNGLGSIVSGLPVHHKQSPIAMKKTALREVQNDNRSLIHKTGGSNADAVKLSGSKRLTPERPSSSPHLKLLRNSFTNGHPEHACKKFDLEQGKMKVQEITVHNANFLGARQYFHELPELPQQQIPNKEHNTSSLPAFSPIPMASQMTFSAGAPSVPISQRKSNDNLPTAILNHIVKSEVPHSVDFEGNAEERRKEQFLCLQKFLKYCDESDQREFIQTLLKFSPAELSSYAFALEKRSIQLSVEEANEIQRKQTLNILGKYSVMRTTR